MVSAIFSILYFALLLYLLLLIGRLVFDWVQVFARDWRPTGALLVLAEIIYTATDPPLRAVRRLIPPLRIGNFALDIGFILVFLAVSLLLRFTYALAVMTA